MRKILTITGTIIGSFLCGCGYLIWFICGMLGFIWELQIVNEIAGFWGVVIGFTILPVTFIATPFYALIAYGDWMPLSVIYGGGIIGTIFVALGVSFIKDKFG